MARGSSKEGRRLSQSVRFWLVVLGMIASWGPIRTSHGEEWLRSWGAAQGLEQSSITALAQTPDGYLWLGTNFGLVRFDGVAFTTYTTKEHPGLTSDRIEKLVVGAGRLWIGTREGISYVERGRIVRVEGQTGTNSGMMTHPDGGVWVSRDDLPLCSTVAPTESLQALNAEARDYLLNPRIGRDGTIWVSDGSLGRLLRWDPASRRVDVIPNIKGEMWPMLERPDGSLLVGTRGGLFLLVGQTLEPIYSWDGVPSEAVLAPDGTVFVGLDGPGVMVFDQDLAPRGLLTDIPPGGVMSLLVDREGNIWVGTYASGLYQITPRLAGRLTLPPEIDRRSVAAVFGDADGGTWVSVPCSGAQRLVDGELERSLGIEEGLTSECVWSFAEHPAGVLWLGTWSGGLFRYDRETGQLAQFHPPELGTDPAIRAIRLAPDGRLLVGAATGLFEVGDEGLVAVPVAGLEGVQGLRHDPAGKLWITSASGVYAERARGIEKVADLESRDVWFIDAANALVTTYGQGLFWLHGGETTPIGGELGFHDLFLGSFFGDAAGFLWFTGNSGLYRIHPEELMAVLQEGGALPAQLHLEGDDGLPATECNGGSTASGFVDPRGVLHVSMIRGVGTADTVELASAIPVSPSVIFEALVAGDKVLNLPMEPLTLEPTTLDVEIHYTAPAFTDPDQLRFRYQLDGSGWKSAGTNRMVLLSELRAGEHTFEAQSKLAGGNWSPPVSLTLVRTPRFHETFWFKAGLVVLALVLLAGLVRYYQHRERVIQRLVEERTQDLARANQKLANLANRDGLTGVATRRVFDERIQLYWHAARRASSTMSLLMIDVDHFKRINDRYGHVAGDACLTQLAKRLQGVPRRALDLVARYGGEEFAIVLPDTDRAGAVTLARRLWSAIRDEPFDLGRGIEIDVTVSIGIASVVPGDSTETRDLVATADLALYRAKQEGRDRIETEDVTRVASRDSAE